jgi:hypothetical protein
MRDAERRGGGARVGSLVERIARRADGVGRHVAAERGNRPADEARIDAARQQRADRHVREESHLDGSQEQPLNFFDRFVELRRVVRRIRLRRDGRRPVSARRRRRIIRRPFDDSGRRNFCRALIDRTPVRHKTEFEIFDN